MSDDAGWTDSEALWAGFFRLTPHGVVVMRVIRDERGRLRDLEWLAINPSAARILEASPEQYVGTSLRTHYPPHLDPKILRRLTAAVHAGGHYEFEHALARSASAEPDPEGRSALEWYSVSIIPIDDRVVILLRSITKYKNILLQAVELMNHDDLTGLPNRRHLKSRFWVLRMHCATMALIYIDLNGFKQVNDTHGHETGDRVLSVIGLRLKQNVRPGETVARIGGDEFAVLLADPEPGIIDLVAERLIGAVEEPIQLEGGIVRLGASVGSALYPDDATSFEALLSASDARMYEDKRQQRGYGGR